MFQEERFERAAETVPGAGVHTSAGENDEWSEKKTKGEGQTRMTWTMEDEEPLKRIFGGEIYGRIPFLRVSMDMKSSDPDMQRLSKKFGREKVYQKIKTMKKKAEATKLSIEIQKL